MYYTGSKLSADELVAFSKTTLEIKRTENFAQTDIKKKKTSD